MKALLMSILLLTASASFAHQHEGPCKADREKFCKDVQPGEGRIVKCLKEHEAELTAECKAKKEEIKEDIKEMKDACHEDAQKFCANEKSGKHHLMKCLKSNEASLSQACKDSMPKHKGKFKK